MKHILGSESKRFSKWLDAIGKRASWELHNLRGWIMKTFPLIVAGRKTASFNGAAIAFSRYCANLLSKQGKNGLALHLKKSQLLLMQKLSGTPMAELLATPVRVKLTGEEMVILRLSRSHT
jgi:hypothetical protein